MYTLKDNGIVEEIRCGNNFGYVINDSKNFINTDYKVLLNQTNDFFVKCMKIGYNGKIELFYITDDYRPVSTMFAGIQIDTLIAIMLNLFAAIVEVRNNGFLSSQNIDVSWDKIFVNANTLKVKLVYVPVNYRVFDSYSEFESELRSSIIRLLNKVITEKTPRLEQFVMDLANGSLSIMDLYNKSKKAEMDTLDMKISNASNSYEGVKTVTENGPNDLKLIAMNISTRFEIKLDRDITILGKKKELVDVQVTFNDMISRKHCRIERKSGVYYLADEKSANGTYINGFRLEPGQLYQIGKGDIIRMADSEFQLV